MAAGYDIGNFTPFTFSGNNPETFEAVYIEIKDFDTDTVLYGSLTIPQAGLPDFAGNPGDPAQAIIDYLTDLFTTITGDPPTAYDNPYTGGGYAFNKDSADQFHMATDWQYDFGLLNFPEAAAGRTIALKFSRNASANLSPFWNPLISFITNQGENPKFLVEQLKSIE